MPRSLTPAERSIAESARLVAEMSRFRTEPDPRLVAAGEHLERALGLVAEFVGSPVTMLPPPAPTPAEERDTDPAPPPSTRSEQPTIPDGAP